MIEALVVTIVGIVILAAASAGIGKLFRSSEITEEIANITQMRTQLVNLSQADRGEYIEGAQAIRFKVVPANMAVKNNHISNRWGGLVLISAWHGNAFIDYFGVPEDACQQLVLKLWNTGWKFVVINKERIARAPTLKDVDTRCAAGGDNNSVSFRMGELGWE